MSLFIDRLVEYIKQNQYPVYSVAEVVGDGAVEGRGLRLANPCQNSYSVAKAFVVTAIGILCDRGLLSTEQIVIDLLSEELSASTKERIDLRWMRVTVDTVLSHRLALPRNFLDIDCCDATQFGNDYLDYLLTYPLCSDHGGERVYTDGAYYLLSRVVEAVAGERLDAFLWRELFSKLGFREVAWSTCPMGHTMGATGLYIRTDDMVKLGALYLNGGCYHGERILSKEWVNTVLERGYELREGVAGAIRKGGMRGQMLAIFPKQNRAVAWHACGFADSDHLLEWIARYQGNEN